MGLGSTAKKLQKVADMAEELYKKINDLRDQVAEMRKTVKSTEERVDGLEAESAEQRALLEAIAHEQGIDVDSIVAEAHIGEAEVPAGEDATTDDANTTSEDGTDDSSGGPDTAEARSE